VLIKVKDNGIGIAPNQLGSIFDMFAQARDLATDNFGGLGIGLALAKQLIEMHGGSIEAKSDGEFMGSEFVVRLPVIEGGMKRKIQPATERAAPSGRRILVVDDNFDSAESMAALLEMVGNDCRMAHSGHEAIEAAETFSPDVMLLDIGLPGIDGYEVCRTIREKPWGKNIWIIAMTGWGQAEDRKRSSEAGFNAHLVKPIDIAKLYDQIESAPPRDRE
jgi:CheY-like chemotaxis protein